MNAHLDIHDLVDELTRPHTHREPYVIRESGTTWTRRHITEVPSLIDQLLDASPASKSSDRGSSGYASRPAARIEALDTLILIDLEAARWVRDLGEDDPGDTMDVQTDRPIPGTGTKACIRRLHGLHPSADPATQRAIEVDVRRWWNQARVVSGWDSPAWRPDNTCPICNERRTLRIRLAAETALCVDCRSVWDGTTIGLLADHIRDENTEDESAAV